MVRFLGVTAGALAVAEDKPFDASAARIARAKREGDVPRSGDLNAVASFACASLVLLGALPFLAGSAGRALREAALGDPTAGPYLTLAACVLVTIAAAACGAVLATYLQARTFTVKFPSLKMEKLAPLPGLKRMFSRDSLIGGAKAVAVASAVGAALVPAVRRSFAASASVTTPRELAAVVERALATIVASALGVAACMAALDVMLERAKWRRRLRMSFDEIKRDHRQTEGDPQLKGLRKRAHRSLVRGSIGRVAEAAFVVANPTHVAIALEYRPPEVAVPRVLVRAIDAGAVEVKRRARELHVPVVENVALARSLLASTDVGEYIVPELYGAVAAIVAGLTKRDEP